MTPALAVRSNEQLSSDATTAMMSDEKDRRTSGVEMADSEDTKQVQVQVYLLKETVGNPQDAIKDSDDPVIPRRLRSPLEGLVLTKRSFPHKPDWAAFIEESIDDELEELATASASALVILKAGPRYFAVTYGYGKSLLDPSTIERRFGLKVALNAIDPSQLRSVDSRTVEEMTFHVRRQASRSSEVSSFGLDTSRDLLRGVTGTPRDANLGSRISGSESVTLSAPITMSDLPALCARLLEVYGGDEYKERFEWIDHLQLVTDPETLDRLEARLAAALADGDTESMHLAPPEALDWQNISGFYYWNPDTAPKHEDLDVDDAISEILGHVASPLTGTYLRRSHVWIEFRENLPVARFTVYSALVFETQVDDRLFVLSDGDWHEVDLGWANSVRQQVAGIHPALIALPDAHSGEHEREYNIRAAKSLEAVPMDRVIVRYGPGRDQFEFCDILTTSQQLIHVKRKTQSATLSHLFMQGQNSAQLFAHDSGFRAAVRESATDAGLEVEAYVPVESVSAADYEIVYAIIAKPNANWPNSLPFFSQLSLSGAKKTLEDLGYHISLALVPLEPA
jgi:uncharacterized protein (TIGR04141 family)